MAYRWIASEGRSQGVAAVAGRLPNVANSRLPVVGKLPVALGLMFKGKSGRSVQEHRWSTY
jgi:hypothetical protein